MIVAAAAVLAQDARRQEKIEQTQQEEGEAVLTLADAAAAGQSVPLDFEVQWQNDFLKAQRGTFVPFTLTIDASGFSRPAALVYVRVVGHGVPGSPANRQKPGGEQSRRDDVNFPVDAIFPVDLQPEPGQLARVSRGFSVGPGDYDVVVVVRERADPDGRSGRPKATVLKERLKVPDFASGELTASTVIVADRLAVLKDVLGADELAERPYVIGQNDITPAADREFRRDEELIVVFLIYNPTVTAEKKFDLQVEYHFFRSAVSGAGEPSGASVPGRPAARDGERYFNRTEPQRFNPSVLGSQFDPGGGRPVMAGQGIPLTGFDAGEYRLAITVSDLISGRSILRDVHFKVVSEREEL